MSLKVLQLDHLHLTSPQDKLKLSLIPSATLRFPMKYPALDDADIVNAMTSGNIWVSRGVRCRLDLRISVDGKPPDRSRYLHLREVIGCYIRDAQLWDHLSLVATLEFHQLSNWKNMDPHISIYINYGVQAAQVKAGPRAWLLENVDVNPPTSVLCAELEKLEIQCNFLTIGQKSAPAAKRTKPLQEGSDSQDLMLLDCPFDRAEDCLEELEGIVGDLSQRLADSVARCFGSLQAANADSHPIPVLSFASAPPNRTSNSNKSLFNVASVALLSDLTEQNKVVGGAFSKEVRRVLKSWWDANSTNPYPTTAEKDELILRTGLQRKQITTWFARNRSKRSAEISGINEDEMQLSQPHDTFAPQLNLGNSAEDSLPSSGIWKFSGKSNRLPNKFVVDLRTWSNKYSDNLLLTKEQMTNMEKQTELQGGQICTWLYTARQRRQSAKLLLKHKNHMIYRPDAMDVCPREFEYPEEDDMLLSQGVEESGEDDMLLSELGDLPPSLASSVSSTASTISPLKRPNPHSNDKPSISAEVSSYLACKLSEAAIRLLVGGYRGPGQGLLDGIKVKKPHSEISLSHLVPAMFCPGFRELMAHNAQFLSTISNTICDSWVHNVQGAGLKSKLKKIAESTASALLEQNNLDELEQRGEERRLVAVVQRRIWSMMQKKLFGPETVRKLTCTGARKGTLSMDADYDEEFLESFESSWETTDSRIMSNYLEGFEGDDLLDVEDSDEDVFEDLLAGDEEGLLDYLGEMDVERERLEIERETDEKLFSSSWDTDEGNYSLMLLRGSNRSNNGSQEQSESESMLV